MVPKTGLMIIAGFLALSLVGVWLARTVGQHRDPYYNCLDLGETRLQLNTHIDAGLPGAARALVAPDGTVALRQMMLPAAPGVMFVEALGSGRRMLTPQPAHQLTGWEWSPDSRYAYYGWRVDDSGQYFGAVVARDGHFLGEMALGYGLADPLGFAADGSYLALQTQFDEVVTFHVLPDFARWEYRIALPAPDSFQIQSVTRSDGRYAWSPQGHLLAYADASEVIVIDPAARDAARIAYAPPDSSSCQQIVLDWSPDGRYLAVSARCAGRDHAIIVFAIGSEGVAPVQTIAIPVEPGVPLDWQFAQWIDGQTLVYFAPQNGPVVFRPWSEEAVNLFEMWRLDLSSGARQKMASNLRDFDRGAGQYATLRQAGDAALIAELRDGAGGGVVKLATFAPGAVDQCAWATEQTLACDHSMSQDASLNLFRADGAQIWPVGDAQVDSLVFARPRSAEERFIAMSLRDDERAWVQIIDTQSGQLHQFPTALNDTLHPDILGAAVDWRFNVTPSPDGRVWLVILGDLGWGGNTLYRYAPDSGEWQALYPDLDVSSALWSPDGARFALTLNDPVERRLVEVWVLEADGSRRWEMGHVPRAMTPDMAWAQCGGVLATVRDRLAAK